MTRALICVLFTSETKKSSHMDLAFDEGSCRYSVAQLFELGSESKMLLILRKGI